MCSYEEVFEVLEFFMVMDVFWVKYIVCEMVRMF